MATTPMTTRATAPVKPPTPRRCCSYFLLLPSTGHRRSVAAWSTKKKNPWLDPFDDGPDEDLHYRGMFSGGKQVEDPQPPEDPVNLYEFLRTTRSWIAWPPKVRSDVRRACCVISGGVYENVLFFPVV
jgi:hypothetical protein